MRANSFDLSGEWYFHGGMMAVGFKKDVYDYIQSTQTVLNIATSNGSTVQAVGTVPQNMGHGKIYGMEFQYQQYSDFLPGALGGLGAEFNATILDSKGARNVSSSTTDAPRRSTPRSWICRWSSCRATPTTRPRSTVSTASTHAWPITGARAT
ncbi:hypothetical protein ACRAWD_18495 [Caulobacter segnis]